MEHLTPSSVNKVKSLTSCLIIISYASLKNKKKSFKVNGPLNYSEINNK